MGYGGKVAFPTNESRGRKLPTELEAKKITVTVAGRSKTTSEVRVDGTIYCLLYSVNTVRNYLVVVMSQHIFVIL